MCGRGSIDDSSRKTCLINRMLSKQQNEPDFYSDKTIKAVLQVAMSVFALRHICQRSELVERGDLINLLARDVLLNADDACGRDRHHLHHCGVGPVPSAQPPGSPGEGPDRDRLCFPDFFSNFFFIKLPEFYIGS